MVKVAYSITLVGLVDHCELSAECDKLKETLAAATGKLRCNDLSKHEDIIFCGTRDRSPASGNVVSLLNAVRIK